MKKGRKALRITISVSEHEWDLIADAAKAKRQSVSAFMRSSAMSKAEAFKASRKLDS